jgi:hypothetical protein
MPRKSLERLVFGKKERRRALALRNFRRREHCRLSSADISRGDFMIEKNPARESRGY